MLGNIVGQLVSPFAVHMVSAGADPDSENWLDITIQPLVSKASSSYQCVVVFRNRDRRPVITFAEMMESKIREIINEIEQRSGTYWGGYSNELRQPVQHSCLPMS